MRARAIAGLVLVTLVVAALSLWVVRGQPTGDVLLPPLDSTRPLPQGGFWVGGCSEPPHLNPFTTTDAVARSLVLRYTHDTLLERDPVTGDVVPAIAELVEANEAGTELSVRLRPGATFSDGSPLAVDDLEFVFRAAQAPGMQLGAVAEAFGLLRDFTRTGERSFRLSLAVPHFKARDTIGTTYPVLQARFWRAAVAAQAAEARVDVPAVGSAAFATLLGRVRLPGPGTGAYALAHDRTSGEIAWRRGTDLVLVQNAASWRRAAQPRRWNLMGMRLRFLPDPAARLAELRAGRLDWYADEDAEAVLAADPQLQERMRLLEYVSPRLGHQMVVWNTRRPPFSDVRVRQALSMLFDRAAIAAKLMRGHGTPAAAWFRPDDPEYPDDLPPVPFDPGAARALLEAAAVTSDDAPCTISILVANQMALHRRILEEAVPAFAVAGLRLAIEQREWAEVVSRYESRDFDAVLMNWNHEPWIDPYANFHSTQADPPGKNYSGLRDVEVDALLERGRVEFDAAARAVCYRRLAHRLRDLEPVSLLVHPRLTLLIDRRFHGAEPGPLGIVADRMWVDA
ncbi:MAG: ABC transporter substrate-binding protein [Planctomycetota bacterium]